MKTTTALIILSVLITLAACDKNKNDSSAPEQSADYLKLKPGNYWIYNEFMLTDRSETDEHVIDSVYVEKDTMINGLTYSKLVKPNHWLQPGEFVNYLRDSSGYIVNHYGTIWFSATDYANIFNTSYQRLGADTVARVLTRMTDKDFAVSTPAGVFLTSSLTRSHHMFPKFDSLQQTITYHTRYAKDVGMVTETLAIFSASPNVRWERRLARWHVR